MSDHYITHYTVLLFANYYSTHTILFYIFENIDGYLSSDVPSVGHLRSFRRDWLKENFSNNLLKFFTNYYVIPFIMKPNLARQSLIISGYKDHQKIPGLLYTVFPDQGHNQKGGKVRSLGFYCHLFQVQKPQQRWRLVIDLSRLNPFLVVEKFKMETSESIKASLVSSRDLLDA